MSIEFLPGEGRNEEINRKMSESVNGSHSNGSSIGSLEEENGNGVHKNHLNDDETKYVTFVLHHKKINKHGCDVIGNCINCALLESSKLVLANLFRLIITTKFTVD